MRLRYSMQIAALISTADAAPRQLLSVHACDSLLCTCTPIMCRISDHVSKTPHRPIKPHLRINILSAGASRISTFESCRDTFVYCSFYPSGYGAADSLCWYLMDTPSVISLSLSCPLVQSTRSSSQLTENK